MIKVELSYNPYLLETKIKFNNQEPRVNSQVEKYVNGSLQAWVKQIPQIFYDEMNGYDFELEFTGTKADFAEIEKAFAEAGVSSKEVRLVHINELDNRKNKSLMIDDLLKWLEKESPELYLKYKDFKEDNYDLFDGFYPYILIQGGAVDTSEIADPDVSVENINRIEELDATNLFNTPILFYVSRENLRYFQNNLSGILERKMVSEEQLFFLIHPSIDSEKLKRIIQDLGVDEPQIVTSVYSEEVRKYMELYPVTEYIINAIKTLRNISEPIAETLEEKREISNKKNQAINQKIQELETRISNLKTALSYFEKRDNVQLPDSWVQKKDVFIGSIRSWRDRKTKITKEDEAKNVAADFNADLDKYYNAFIHALGKDVNEKVDILLSDYESWYQTGGYDLKYKNSNQNIGIYRAPDMPQVKHKLQTIKDEAMVPVKEAIFSHFFKGSSTQPIDMVLEVTYSYQKWREYVLSVAEPIAEKVVQEYYSRLIDLADRAAKEYASHLEKLIKEQTQEKNKTVNNLSEDEKLLQGHINWITEFREKIGKIERG